MRIAIPTRVPIGAILFVAIGALLWYAPRTRVVVRTVPVPLPVPFPVATPVPVLAQVPIAIPLASDPGGHALAVALDGEDAFSTLAPANGSVFPAVSEDGTTVVYLFQDAIDFVGTPVATVRFWHRDGTIESYEYEPDVRGVDPRKLVAQINRRLARERWRTLPMGTASDLAVTLDDGVRLEYGPNRNRLRWFDLDGHAHRVPGPVPALGTADADVGGGGCGEIQHLDAFGSRAIGFAVVIPSGGLGGDSCFGSLSVDTSIVVRLR